MLQSASNQQKVTNKLAWERIISNLTKKYVSGGALFQSIDPSIHFSALLFSNKTESSGKLLPPIETYVSKFSILVTNINGLYNYNLGICRLMCILLLVEYITIHLYYSTNSARILNCPWVPLYSSNDCSRNFIN